MSRKKLTRTKGKPRQPARRRGKPAEKRTVPVERSGTMPEVFDSNRYDAMSELNESATMQGRDVRKTLSHLKREERLDPESTTVKPEGKSLAVNPTLDEQAEELRESKRAQDKTGGGEGLQSYRRE